MSVVCWAAASAARHADERRALWLQGACHLAVLRRCWEWRGSGPYQFWGAAGSFPGCSEPELKIKGGKKYTLPGSREVKRQKERFVRKDDG